MSSGDSPVTFQGFDKKDWLYRETLVDDCKEKIQCLTNALLVEHDDTGKHKKCFEYYQLLHRMHKKVNQEASK